MITKKKKTVRNTNTWRLDNTFLNNQPVTEEIKREIKKKILETNDNENTTTQNLWGKKKSMGFSKSSSKMKVYSNIILPQETRKTSNKQDNFTPKTPG